MRRHETLPLPSHGAHPLHTTRATTKQVHKPRKNPGATPLLGARAVRLRTHRYQMPMHARTHARLPDTRHTEAPRPEPVPTLCSTFIAHSHYRNTTAFQHEGRSSHYDTTGSTSCKSQACPGAWFLPMAREQAGCPWHRTDDRKDSLSPGIHSCTNSIFFISFA
jgi:hypothetical protein